MEDPKEFSEEIKKVMLIRRELLERIIEKSGLKISVIAQKLNISRTSFYNWLDTLTDDRFVKICNAIDSIVNLGDYIEQSDINNVGTNLFSGKILTDFLSDKWPSSRINEETNVVESRGHWYKVINSIDAGDPQLIYRTENYTGEEAYFPFGSEKSCFALKVEGDSMTNPYGDSIPNGEYVLADLSESALPGDIIVVSLTGGRQMIKQYVEGPEDNITLRSFNPNYPDIVVKKIDVIKMVRVIGQGHFKRR